MYVQAPRLAPDPGTAGLNVRDLHPPQNDVTLCTVIENKTSTFDDTKWQLSMNQTYIEALTRNVDN